MPPAWKEAGGRCICFLRVLWNQPQGINTFARLHIISRIEIKRRRELRGGLARIWAASGSTWTSWPCYATACFAYCPSVVRNFVSGSGYALYVRLFRSTHPVHMTNTERDVVPETSTSFPYTVWSGLSCWNHIWSIFITGNYGNNESPAWIVSRPPDVSLSEGAAQFWHGILHSCNCHVAMFHELLRKLY
jgi:hypothetical protein